MEQKLIFSEYANLAAVMEENPQHYNRQQEQILLGKMKRRGKVHEGRILRSTAGKDRHSKVSTFKGPRDRRVRLSAHTAIQFYDVQDRLGYDRPSKAVDWLIEKAKTAIDELKKLSFANAHPPSTSFREFQTSEDPLASPFAFKPDGILPPLDSDAIANTINSFFPTKEDLRLSLLPREPSQIYGAVSSHWGAPLHPLTGQGSYLSQRGSLQSSNSENIRSLEESFSDVEEKDDAGTAFGGFPGFFVPAQVHDGGDPFEIPSFPS